MSTLEAFTSCNPLEVVNAIALPDAWARHVKQRQTKILTRTSVPLIHPIIKLIEWINISYMINLISNLISRTHNWSRPSKLRWIGNKPIGGQVLCWMDERYSHMWRFSLAFICEHNMPCPYISSRAYNIRVLEPPPFHYVQMTYILKCSNMIGGLMLN